MIESPQPGRPDTGYDQEAGHAEAAHPGPREYIVIAIVLAVVTGLEVALFYLNFLPSSVVVASLLVLMVIKFSLVVLWFMHLRFESPIFKRLFVTGVILALSIFLAVLVMFRRDAVTSSLSVAFVVVLLFFFLIRPRLLRRARA
ncbi:MAG TPA: cytochrome C oxidase subunit IV family protein [Actinomycetota bacterium]|nr:cytochrome C oxidase subunit IV family protein [Actinomycetota bacterium]